MSRTLTYEARRRLTLKLRTLTNPRVLKTDEQDQKDREEARRILSLLGCRYVEDAVEKYLL